jgi:hypothetical protein
LTCIRLALDRRHDDCHSCLQESKQLQVVAALRRGEIMKIVVDQFAETLAAAGGNRICSIVGDSPAIEPQSHQTNPEPPIEWGSNRSIGPAVNRSKT